MKIPFADLKRQYISIEKDITSTIETLFNDFQFIGSIGNPHVTRFEKNFATYLNVRYVVGCANGTDAIEIALKSLGIKEGDEVIVPAMSWFSTSEAVSAIGAIPIFVDVSEDDITINTSLIEKAITPKTVAIIPVHLYGSVCNMGKIKEIATKYDLKILEDCAQAHGAKFEGQTVGTIGDIATFSFYPGKNLGAYGDAGAIVTNNIDYATTCRLICQHGQSKKHIHELEGRNSRLDGIHAAVLDVKLKHLKNWTVRRQQIAQAYNTKINNPKISILDIPNYSEAVYHLYVIKTNYRAELIEYLNNNGIESTIHYPTPLPLLKPYQKFKLNNLNFKTSIKIKEQILSIPMFPEMTDEEVNFVITTLNNF